MPAPTTAVITTTAMAVAAQPKGQLPPGPALFYGFGMIAALIFIIVIEARDRARHRKLYPTLDDLLKQEEEKRKQRQDEAFTAALVESAKEKPHHRIPERYLK